jgi:hypothetical protein
MTEQSGLAGVASDGTPLGSPYIALDPVLGTNEMEVVHELSHLQLIAQGFPANIAVPVIPAGVDRDSLYEALRTLPDILWHRLFYPRMRRMGFAPDRKFRSQMEAEMANPNSAGRSAVRAAVEYAYVAVLDRDPAFVARVEKWYRKRGWTEGLAKGKSLHDSIIRASPTSPDDSARELIICLNILFENKFPARWGFRNYNLYLGTFDTSAIPPH